MAEADEKSSSIGNMKCKADPYTKDLTLWNVCNTLIANVLQLERSLWEGLRCN